VFFVFFVVQIFLKKRIHHKEHKGHKEEQQIALSSAVVFIL